MTTLSIIATVNKTGKIIYLTHGHRAYIGDTLIDMKELQGKFIHELTIDNVRACASYLTGYLGREVTAIELFKVIEKNHTEYTKQYT